MSDLRWYTLKVKTGKELYVKEWLKENKNEIEIDDVIVPVNQKYKKNGTKGEVAAFGGYIFVKMNLFNYGISDLKKIPYSKGLLGVNKNNDIRDAISVKKKDIDKILNYNMSSSTSSVGRTYHIGDEVSIIAGPFSNFKGVIDKISYDLQKVQLSVMFFSRPTIISVDLNQIQK